jgi:hypothetical protein
VSRHLLTLALIATLAACASSTPAPVAPAPAEEATAAEPEPPPAPPPSVARTATEDGFAIRIPGAAQVMRNKVTIPAGEVNTAAWTASVDGVIYSISFADYPEKLVRARPASAFLDEARDGLVNQLKGTLVEETAIALADHPGKAFTVTSENGDVKARCYLVGGRLYTLLVLYNPALGAKQLDAFLGSLELTRTVAPLTK